MLKACLCISRYKSSNLLKNNCKITVIAILIIIIIIHFSSFYFYDNGLNSMVEGWKI